MGGEVDDRERRQVDGKVRLCAGPTPIPILHLHLLRRCNLTCRHCYSVSGPHAKGQLSLMQVRQALALAETWGYAHVAISGGEPLLHPNLQTIVDEVCASGMSCSLVTNGLLLGRPGMVDTLRRVGTVTISVDGLEQTHDQIRGRAGAFLGALGAVSMLSEAGCAVGVACGVHQGNLDEVEALLGIVQAHGAKHVALHAIEAAGRAIDEMAGRFLGEHDRAVLYVLAKALESGMGEACQLHCDLTLREQVLQEPWLVYAGDDLSGTLPAQQLGVLVVEPDGTLVPVSYDFSRRLALGKVGDQALDADALWARFACDGLQRLRKIGAAVYAELRLNEDVIVVNPSEELARAAAEAVCVA